MTGKKLKTKDYFKDEHPCKGSVGNLAKQRQWNARRQKAAKTKFPEAEGAMKLCKAKIKERKEFLKNQHKLLDDKMKQRRLF